MGGHARSVWWKRVRDVKAGAYKIFKHLIDYESKFKYITYNNKN